MVDEEWAAPDSLLGRLQRGRGLGYRQALATPGADALVLACIAHEPRWDRQTEERAEYYARLVVDLGIPAGGIPLDLDDPDVLLGVPFGVLVELSRGGSTDAAAMLHTYFARADEPDWWVVGHLWHEAGPAGREGLAELVLDRIDDESLAGAVTLHEDGPWRAWAHLPRVAAALAVAVQPEPWPGLPDLSSRTVQELHVLAAGAFSGERSSAFRELSRRGDLALLDLAEREDLRHSGGATASLGQPVVDLGDAALPRARTWIDGGDGWLRGLGMDIISAHGGPEDAPQILRWLDEAVADGEWCVTEDLADGLARLGHMPAVPSIARAWELTPHSFARTYYLPALIQLEPPDLQVYLDEAADDCESDVRDIASKHLAPAD